MVTYYTSARATMCEVNFTRKSFHTVELILLNVADVLVTQKASFGAGHSKYYDMKCTLSSPTHAVLKSKKHFVMHAD